MTTPQTILAPIIVTALLGRADQAWFDGLRAAHFPPERNFLSAHLTMFHHLPPSAADEVKRRLADEVREPAPTARLAPPFSLGRGVAYRIDSPGLEQIRNRIGDAFAGSLMPQDQAGWRPHVTVQNKVESALARELLANLSRDFGSRPVVIAGLASWWYRGGPWEPLSRHMFRV